MLPVMVQQELPETMVVEATQMPTAEQEETEVVIIIKHRMAVLVIVAMEVLVILVRHHNLS